MRLVCLKARLVSAMAAQPGSAPRSKRRQSTPIIDEYVAEFIKRTVQKMSCAENMTILRTWGFLSEKELQTLTVKGRDNAAMDVVRLCEGKKATLNNAADLDIVYNHANAKKKTWHVYQMTDPSDAEKNHMEVLEFKSRFKKSIHSVMKNVTIHFKDFGDALWIRLAWGNFSARPNQYRPTFVVYHTQTPYAFITGLLPSSRPVLCQALSSAARYSDVQHMELKGRCLDSLKDIVFKRFHQSLQAHHSRPPLQVRNYTPAIVDSNVTYENIREKERIHHMTLEAFGDGPLPKIEYASYKLDTAFKGKLDIAKKIEPFRCVVKFSSPHLLEAIKSVAPTGIAEAPVSGLLTSIPHRARNTFKISEKKAPQPTSSQGT